MRINVAHAVVALGYLAAAVAFEVAALAAVAHAVTLGISPELEAAAFCLANSAMFALAGSCFVLGAIGIGGSG